MPPSLWLRSIVPLVALLFCGSAEAQKMLPARVSLASGDIEMEGPDSQNGTISADGKYVAFKSLANNLVKGDLNGHYDIFRGTPNKGPIELVSITKDGIQANGDCWDPFISGDGNYIVFTSNATNLDPAQTNGKVAVYLKDMTTQSLKCVSAGSNGDSGLGSVNDKGTYVVFQSLGDNLVPNDKNGFRDIFLYDVLGGGTRRVSVVPDGTSVGKEANGGSSQPQISADGKQIVFQSNASNLGPDKDAVSDVYMIQFDLKKIQLISVVEGGILATDGAFDPTVNGDGTYVAFRSSPLDDHGKDVGSGPIYLRDLAQGKTILVSKRIDGGKPAFYCQNPSISRDGNYILYSSDSSHLVKGDQNDSDDAFVYNRQDGKNYLCSVDKNSKQGFRQVGVGTTSRSVSDKPAQGKPGPFACFRTISPEFDPNAKTPALAIYVKDITNGDLRKVSVSTTGFETGGGDGTQATMSEDGKYVAFTSNGGNASPQDFNAANDVFLRDVGAKRTTIVSVNKDGAPGHYGGVVQGDGPFISSDGRFIGFVGRAQNLVDDHPNIADIFYRAVGDKPLTSVTFKAANPSDADSWEPRISRNNDFIVFTSLSTKLFPGTSNKISQVYRYQITTGKLMLISSNAKGEIGNGPSYHPVVSDDGRYVAFESAASNLVTDDKNGVSDIFLRDVDGKKTIRISVDSSGAEVKAGGHNPWISGDGSKVVFDSNSYKLANDSNTNDADPNLACDIFLRKWMATSGDKTELVSKSSEGLQGKGPSQCPWISQDGRYVTFTSLAIGLVAGETGRARQGYRRDLVTGQTLRLSENSNGVAGDADTLAYPIQLDKTNSIALLISAATNLVSNDLNQASDVFEIAISPRFEVSSLVAAPTTLLSGQTGKLTLKLNYPAPKEGLSVTLSSNDVNLKLAQTTVSFVAGTDTAAVNVSAVAPRDMKVATVTAKIGDRAKTVNVTLQPWIQSLDLTPSEVVGGNTVQGTITLVSSAPAEGFTIKLKSGDGAATVNSTVTIKSKTTVTFTIQTSKVTTKKTVKITCTLLDQTITMPLTIKPS